MTTYRYNIRRFDLFYGSIKLLRRHVGKLLLFSAILTTLAFNTQKFENLRNKCNDISGATYTTISYPIYWIKDKYQAMKTYIVVLKDDKNIYLENQKSREELRNLAILKKENDDLKQLLNFQDNFIFSKITGRVVLGSSEDFHDRYLLNIGLENGVQKGNAIVDSNGLIGRITDVSDKSSTIQLITSNDSKVPISILGTHYRGVAAGTYKDGYLKLLYLPEEAEVNEGQIVVTSGEERYIPHGIYIGKIVKQDKEIYVEVAKNDDKNLSMVSVLKLEDNFADARKKPK